MIVVEKNDRKRKNEGDGKDRARNRIDSWAAYVLTSRSIGKVFQ